ncbi:MAG: hypothetical protein PHN80_12555 [Hespellia sp.]|nr:hypothetical protein [Hespellia sp.]
MQIEKKITREMANRIFEVAYLVMLAMYTGFYFLNTTTFEMTWSTYFYSNMRIGLLLIIFARASLAEEYKLKEIAGCILVALVLLVAWEHNGFDELRDIVLLLVGAKDISYKKILKVYVGVVFVLLSYTMISALTGRIDNLIFRQDGRRARIAFGIGYPTDFSAYIFYMVLAVCCLRKEKIRYIEIGMIVLLGIFVYMFCDARLNTICLILVAGVMFYHKLRCSNAEKRGEEYEMNAIFSMLLALSATIFAFIMIGLSMLYSTDNKFLLLADRVLNNRLRLGKKGIDLYGFSIFGQQIPMIGNGGSTKQPKNYFFLDSSYLSASLRFGILAFGALLLILLVIAFRAREKKKWTLLWMVALMSLQCVVEHHMTDVSYCVMLYLFASDMTEVCRTKGTIKWFRRKKYAKDNALN